MSNSIVVLSGKGGVGKSVVSSAIAEHLSKTQSVVLADADVDCPNQHMLFNGNIISRTPMHVTKVAKIIEPLGNIDRNICAFGAIQSDSIDKSRCTGCGACLIKYPEKFKLVDKLTGHMIHIETKRFPLVYGILEPGESGSGKLVNSIRKKAESIGADDSLILVDAPAGIGCPVVAATTGCKAALCVVEPTPASIGALKKAIKMLDHFSIPYYLVINKDGISNYYASKIENEFSEKVIARIPYDEEIPRLLAAGKLPYLEEGSAPDALRVMCSDLSKLLKQRGCYDGYDFA
jgi:MinD superfamily P-loop ATPase